MMEIIKQPKVKNGYLYVLSGGGLRALECHAGMYDALAELGLTPDYGRGSSAGAAVLGFEFSKRKTIDIIKSTPKEKCLKRNSWWTYVVKGGAVYDNSGFKQLLKDNIIPGGLDDVVVTMTDTVQRETVFTRATAESVFNSTSMPEVFPYGRFSGTYWDWKGKIKIAEDMEVADGGVYNNIPMPNMKTADEYDHIFVFVCNEDITSEEIHKKSKIGRSLAWIAETSEREYRQIVNDWQWLPNVTILRPPPFRSSLLDWSEDFGLYDHARGYAKKMILDAYARKDGVFKNV